MKKKSTLWIAIVMVALVAFFLKLAFTKSDDKDKRGDKGKVEKKIDAIIVKPSLLINEISVSGSLLAFEEVELKNEVAGRVVKINLPEGKFEGYPKGLKDNTHFQPEGAEAVAKLVFEALTKLPAKP